MSPRPTTSSWDDLPSIGSTSTNSQRGKYQRKTKTLEALNVKVLTTVTTLDHPSSVTSQVMARGLTVHRYGLLIVQTTLDGSRRMELHRLGIVTLSSNFAAVFYTLDLRFKIVLYPKGVGRQDDFSVSASTLERASSSWCSKFFRSASRAFTFFSFSEPRLYLVVTSSNLWRSTSRSNIHLSKVEIDGLDFTTFSARAKIWKIPKTLS
ncbi:hypothetical protein Cgig2_030022 [Carnegiea gigantea]|uniref:Uncharacterized protein n=1 Tax=Carnegiea gigantea TaxID=171969 RepID=A0A9Q1JGA1_9CARY|nr:hypothetical protein Cgig2_030022 [Carnegiea gigantea]